MRRCLHSLLVGGLMFMIGIDAVRACGHLRQRCRPAGCPAPWSAPPRRVAWTGCEPCIPAGWGRVVAVECASVGWACGCGAPAGATLIGEVVAAYEPIACGVSIDCCGPAAAVASAPVPAQVEASVVVPTPVAEPAPAAAASEPAPAAAPSPVASSVPDLEPVEPVSAIEPVVPSTAEAVEPELTMPPDEAVAPEATDASVAAGDEAATGTEAETESAPEPTPEPPQRRNAFDEAEEGAAASADAPQESPAAPTPNEFDAGPVEDAAGDSSRDELVPADAAPAEEPEHPAEPSAAAEPSRRWIDVTASYATVGRLVDVRGDVVEILKADGRRVRVSLDRLSRFDRDYVVEAGPRVAAVRGHGPRAVDTASR